MYLEIGRARATLFLLQHRSGGHTGTEAKQFASYEKRPHH